MCVCVCVCVCAHVCSLLVYEERVHFSYLIFLCAVFVRIRALIKDGTKDKMQLELCVRWGVCRVLCSKKKKKKKAKSFNYARMLTSCRAACWLGTLQTTVSSACECVCVRVCVCVCLQVLEEERFTLEERKWRYYTMKMTVMTKENLTRAAHCVC